MSQSKIHKISHHYLNYLQTTSLCFIKSFSSCWSLVLTGSSSHHYRRPPPSVQSPIPHSSSAFYPRCQFKQTEISLCSFSRFIFRPLFSRRLPSSISLWSTQMAHIWEAPIIISRAFQFAPHSWYTPRSISHKHRPH